MARLLWIVVISQTILSAQGFFPNFRQRQFKSEERTLGDTGEALFLTPFVESGKIDKGQKLARVSFEGLSIESYAGYFTVNKTYNSNHFFWYFPSQENSATAPVVVWMNGGPGSSSLFGLFEENGPFTITNKSIQPREIHWAKNHHVIYIDNPVGTGFSFTRDDKGYCTDQTQIGEQLYSTVTQFFKLFPKLQKNKFFVTGESYAGKYVPALAYTIHKKNPTADLKINLQGIAIGDGWSDPEHQLVYSDYVYQVGLVDWNTKENIKKKETETAQLIQKEQWAEAQKSWHSLLTIIDGNMMYNFLNLTSDAVEPFAPVVDSDLVRKAIHVGNETYKESSGTVHQHLKADMMKSIAPWITELLDHYPVVTYNGQLDVIVAYPLTVNFLRHLNFTGAEDYAKAKRYEWKVGGEVAGFVKQAGRLTELLVRGAGHMVPADQPAWAWDMITRITHGQPFH